MSRHDHSHPAVAPAEVLDPVCGMTISPDDAVGHVSYRVRPTTSAARAASTSSVRRRTRFSLNVRLVPLRRPTWSGVHLPHGSRCGRRDRAPVRSAEWRSSRSLSPRSRRPSGRARCIPRSFETLQALVRSAAWRSSHASSRSRRATPNSMTRPVGSGGRPRSRFRCSRS